MQDNPKLKIDIPGHMCCSKDRTNLSGDRAKSVYNILVKNGIDKSRMTYRGFGSEKPIYPLPEKTEEERVANRRVEIEILEN
jgi:outer membrane protein OmpA-like peptidoglycan-associated protein